ncbi:hypothetical protein TSUD_148160 [Trifolium subterraneum]|uniref:non-specific serine/threonine protein kinase n=1 Tax=Trifolium subterraneum TaxID=3900 RepID=A0A2Z6MDK4_TRISU|nr:hypothetical protein TSUD_148160 [Trifolium subterraneum]
MPLDSSEQDDDPEIEFSEIDPTGRYGRYKEVLGKGAFKKVYRAFDELEGIEVAWNQVKVSDLLRNSEDLERLYSEVHLLKTLKHKNIIKFYSSWVDTKNENINFITEIFTSGTLRQYRKKHKHVDLRALKKWSRQILEGTPEFMAPELYEEEYNELVDIYAFGMCLLELVTVEYPYVECANAAQIYKKVTSGIKPASLAKVNDPDVKAFIEKCTAHVSERLPAKALLMDPFLQSNWDGESVGLSSLSGNQDSGNNFDNQSIEKGAKDNFVETSREFTVEGQRRDVNTIFLKLRIADSSGHIRNIHFPFDIGADTSFSVASEMVEELELTDQDVSTIAMTIDSEIRYHIPSWSPSETPDNNYYQTSCQTPETMVVASPMGNESPASLALEILPSGRKYWSDSPRAFGASSPSLLHGASNLSYEVECDGTADSPFNKCITSEYFEATGGKSSQEKMPVNLKDFETEDLNKIATKLETMLTMQREELDELKRKHKLAVSDFLNEFSPEFSLQVLNICNMQMPDDEM